MYKRRERTKRIKTRRRKENDRSIKGKWRRKTPEWNARRGMKDERPCKKRKKSAEKREQVRSRCLTVLYVQLWVYVRRYPRVGRVPRE
jgi:hypothetical protein